VTISEDYSQAWSVLLRVHSLGGWYQLYNGGFRGFTRTDWGSDVMIHSNWWNQRDMHDGKSFVIKADRLKSPDHRNYIKYSSLLKFFKKFSLFNFQKNFPKKISEFFFLYITSVRPRLLGPYLDSFL
jgi:hypothetical protein